jgi:hypothetical protein
MGWLNALEARPGGDAVLAAGAADTTRAMSLAESAA